MKKSNKTKEKVKRPEIKVGMKVGGVDSIIPIKSMTFIFGRDISPADFRAISENEELPIIEIK